MRNLLTGVCAAMLMLSNVMASGQIVLLDVLVEMITMLITLLIFLINFRYIKIAKSYTLCEVLILGILLVASVSNTMYSGVRPIIVMTVKGVAFILLFSKYLKYDTDNIFSIITKVTIVLGVLNLVLMILTPNLFGENKYFIAPNRNNFPNLFLPGILSGFILSKSKIKNGRDYYWILLTVALLTVCIVKSVTSIIGIGLVAAYSLLEHKSNFIRKYSAIFLLLGIVLFFCGIVLLNDISIIAESNLVGNFLDKADKDITFSGRTWVWMSAIEMIYDHPFKGIGYYWGEWAMDHFQVSNTHNVILEILLTGGVLFLVLIVTMIVKLLSKVRKQLKSDCASGILFIFTVYLLMMQFEVYGYIMQFIFYFIIYCSLHTKELKKSNCDAGNISYSPYLQS